MTMVPFTEAKDVGDRFIALLDHLGINPPPNSARETELLSLMELVDVAKNPALAQGTKSVEILRAAGGIHDLAAKVLSVQTLPEASEFHEHLKLIASANDIGALLSQNTQSANDTSRKIAELYIGCLAAHVGSEIRLDSPTRAKGDNPDIIFSVDNKDAPSGKSDWALAIKTVASQSGQTIFERIKDATRQIDAPSCPAEYGIVILNMKGAIDHESLWKTPFSDVDGAMVALARQLEDFIAKAELDRPQSEWDELFTGRAVRPVLFLGQSLVRIATGISHETPTQLKMLLPAPFGGPQLPIALEIATGLNHFMQTILLGYGASDTSYPR